MVVNQHSETKSDNTEFSLDIKSVFPNISFDEHGLYLSNNAPFQYGISDNSECVKNLHFTPLVLMVILWCDMSYNES